MDSFIAGAVLAAVLLGPPAAIGVWTYYDTRDNFRQQAIDAGVAEYACTKAGDCEFKFIPNR